MDLSSYIHVALNGSSEFDFVVVVDDGGGNCADLCRVIWFYQ